MKNSKKSSHGARISNELGKLHKQYANDDISLYDLEIEISYWLEVEECETCRAGGSICSHHYEAFIYGWGADWER